MLEKTLESPLDCKEIQPVHPKGDQSWIFIGRLMLKLKLQYFGHLMQRMNSLEKTLMLGKIEGRRRRGWQRMRWLDGITDAMDMSLIKLRELVCCSPWGHKELDTPVWLTWMEHTNKFPFQFLICHLFSKSLSTLSVPFHLPLETNSVRGSTWNPCKEQGVLWPGKVFINYLKNWLSNWK